MTQRASQHSKALKGRRILVTRAREQAAGLSGGLRHHGAEVVEAPAIRIEPPLDWTPVDEAIQHLELYHWIIFTSANGVRFFLERVHVLGRDTKQIAGAKLAAIGPSTRGALEAEGFCVDVVPERYVAEEVFEALRRYGHLKGKRILLPRANIAREALPELLQKEGSYVDVVVAYRTVPARDEIRRAAHLVTQGQIDVVTFTSGSTVQSFFSVVEDLQSLRGSFVPASIGPITSRALRDHGFPPGIEAKSYTSEGLVEAIVDYYA